MTTRSHITKRDQAALDQLEDELLKPGEVAALFGVTRETIQRWAAAGKLPAVETPGGHRRYRRSEIEQLAPQG